MPQQFLDSVLQTIQTYGVCARAATQALLKNWFIPVAAVGLYIIILIASNLVSPLGIAGGFILGLLFIYALSLFYRWIAEAHQGRRIRFKEYLEFDFSLFSALMSVGFLLWIVEYLAKPLKYSEETLWVYACINAAIFLLVNPISEVIFIQRYESLGALREAFDFVRRYPLEWFAPIAVLLLPLWLLSSRLVLMSIAGADPLWPAGILATQINMYFEIQSPQLGWLTSAIAIVLATWVTLFRAKLFEELSAGKKFRWNR
jgi:hypothetical protein